MAAPGVGFCNSKRCSINAPGLGFLSERAGAWQSLAGTQHHSLFTMVEGDRRKACS